MKYITYRWSVTTKYNDHLVHHNGRYTHAIVVPQDALGGTAVEMVDAMGEELEQSIKDVAVKKRIGDLMVKYPKRPYNTLMAAVTSKLNSVDMMMIVDDEDLLPHSRRM